MVKSLILFKVVNIKFFILICLFFLLFFSPDFSAIPFKSLHIIFLVSFLFFSISVLGRKLSHIDRRLLFFFMLGMLQFVFYFITMLIAGAQEKSQLITMLVFFIVYPVISYFIVCFLMGREFDVKKVVDIAIVVLVAQLFLSFLVTLSPLVRESVFNLLVVDSVRLEASSRVRLIGFGVSYFHLGTLMSLGFMLCLYSLVKFKRGAVSCSALIFISILFFVGGFFSARVSVFGMLAVMFVLLFYNVRIYTNITRTKLHTFLLLSAFFPVFFVFIVSNVSVMQFYDDSFEWAAEFFVSMISGQGGSTESSDHLINKMYFLPDTIKTFIFGDGRMFQEGGYYMSTDAGYIRQVFSYGIVGAILSYAVYGYLFYIISRSFGKFFSISIAIMVVVYNIKGIFIYYSSFDFFIVFCFVYTLMNHSKKERSEF